mmetsp:Transcript_27439/g.57267  ORF Transcript_27439/g.57267 Transcript_27439/m.57267 type:complete len:240 (-) Transcript_27439:476-1195(-)
MGETEMSNATPNDGTKKRKAESTPPDGYVCRLCSVPGHWIQVCPTKKTGAKRQRKSDHVPVPGQDPSEEDIEKAKELQAIPPPKCFCGVPSRLNKVKRSKAGGDASRAIGKYFFFCSKKRDDDTQCRFARPVEMELKKMKRISERVKAKPSGEKDKKLRSSEDKKAEKSKPKQICKFFAKNGSCKKASKCEFSHDIQSTRVPGKAPKKQETTTPAIEETESDTSSDDSSSDDSSSDEEE